MRLTNLRFVNIAPVSETGVFRFSLQIHNAREVVMKFWARAITVMIASIAGGSMSHAADLIVLASQGNCPG